jgi:hypothetical protein
MQQQAQQQYQLQREMFDILKKPTPEQERFRRQSDEWEKFIRSKDYGNPPSDSVLNFNLFTPAQIAKMRERMENITGTGATALSGTGDQSIAIAQAKERNINQVAQDQANAYENALLQADAYYKGNALPYAQLDINKNLGLLGNATSSSQFFTQMQGQSIPQSFWQTLGPALIGGAFRAGASLLGNPGLFKKK